MNEKTLSDYLNRKLEDPTFRKQYEKEMKRLRENSKKEKRDE